MDPVEKLTMLAGEAYSEGEHDLARAYASAARVYERDRATLEALARYDSDHDFYD